MLKTSCKNEWFGCGMNGTGGIAEEFGDSQSKGTGSAFIKYAFAATMMAVLAAQVGTAPKLDAQRLLAKQNPGSCYLDGILPIATAGSSSDSVPGNIQKVVSTFAISISEMARVFGVSRQTVYNWKNGEAISSENESKLIDMANSADIFLRERISLSGAMLNRKIIDGKSLMDIALDGQLISGAAKVLADRLVKERGQRELMATRLAGRPAISPSADSDLIPSNDRS